MKIDSVLEKLKLKLKILNIEKLIDQIEFQFCNNEDIVAFLQGTTIYYTNKLFLDFTEEEQVFIIAYEIMHYIRHYSNGKYEGNKNKDEDLLNFVEDAQINQMLLKLGLTCPKDGVIVSDALDYTEEELYNLLLPKLKDIKGWAKGLTDWSKFSSTTDILNSNEFVSESVTSTKR